MRKMERPSIKKLRQIPRRRLERREQRKPKKRLLRPPAKGGRQEVVEQQRLRLLHLIYLLCHFQNQLPTRLISMHPR
jgi:hypothetical protein